jgi:hypothetical protein
MVINDAKQWAVSHFGECVVPAFSYMYEGKRSEHFILSWKFSQKNRQLDDVRTEHTYTYDDTETKLQVRCECVIFKDYPAVEWVLKFRNNAGKETPIIEDVHVLDAVFTRKGEGDFILHRALGNSISRKDYAPVDELINHISYLAPTGGRSSFGTTFPFFNIEASGEGGVMVGIGWSGQWAATLAKEDASC